MKTLKNRIVKDRIANFKDINKRNTLGTLIGELDRKDKEPDDIIVIATIKKMIEGCKEVGTREKMDEIEIIRVYLPKELTEDELVNLIKEDIVKNNYLSVKDMGKIMKVFNHKLCGQYDGKLASNIVKSLLTASMLNQ